MYLVCIIIFSKKYVLLPTFACDGAWLTLFNIERCVVNWEPTLTIYYEFDVYYFTGNNYFLLLYIGKKIKRFILHCVFILFYLFMFFKFCSINFVAEGLWGQDIWVYLTNQEKCTGVYYIWFLEFSVILHHTASGNTHTPQRKMKCFICISIIFSKICINVSVISEFTFLCVV